MGYVADIVNRCLSLGDETEWFEYKDNLAVSDADAIGEYISALSNGAAMTGESFGYLIWGIHDKTHGYTNTTLNYQKDIKNEPFQHYIGRNVSPSLFFHFDEESINGNRVVVLTIPAARSFPTSYRGERYIRIGSSKENLKKYPARESELFRILNYGAPTILNTPSRFEKLSFSQLFLYFETKGFKLREDTFKENLELLTTDGKYNILAQLLSDDPHIDIQFAVFAGKTKASTMYAVRNFGHTCILLSLDKVLDFGDTLNVPQADERERKVERTEVMLFNKDAFREAVINAFVHNTWIYEIPPMFTAFQDRIEITSMGTLPPRQTKEGFYHGRSIPVNLKLSEIFIQLHISERTGRGVPRIVEKYGEGAFEFADNSIVVTIPYNRLALGDTPSETPLVTPQDTPSDTPLVAEGRGNVTLNNTDRRILEYCAEARGSKDILAHLGLTDMKNLRDHLKKLMECGLLERTVPEKATSRDQKYLAKKQ